MTTPVKVSYKGQSIQGHYIINGRKVPLITVIYNGKRKTIQVGEHQTVDILAEILLLELLEQHDV